MTVISLLLVLVLVGVALYVVNTILPMDPKIKTILNAVVVVIVLVWLLESFGVFGSYSRPLRMS